MRRSRCRPRPPQVARTVRFPTAARRRVTVRRPPMGMATSAYLSAASARTASSTVQVTPPVAERPSQCLASSADNDSWPKALDISRPRRRAFLVDRTSSRTRQDALVQVQGRARPAHPGHAVRLAGGLRPGGVQGHLQVFDEHAHSGQRGRSHQGEPRNTRRRRSRPSAFTPSAFTPSAFTPSAFTPSAFTPSAFTPSAFTPSAFYALGVHRRRRSARRRSRRRRSPRRRSPRRRSLRGRSRLRRSRRRRSPARSFTVDEVSRHSRARRHAASRCVGDLGLRQRIGGREHAGATPETSTSGLPAMAALFRLEQVHGHGGPGGDELCRRHRYDDHAAAAVRTVSPATYTTVILTDSSSVRQNAGTTAPAGRRSSASSRRLPGRTDIKGVVVDVADVRWPARAGS